MVCLAKGPYLDALRKAHRRLGSALKLPALGQAVLYSYLFVKGILGLLS
jgi:hypothetical protein